MTDTANYDRPQGTPKRPDGYESWLDFCLADGVTARAVKQSMSLGDADCCRNAARAELAALRAKSAACPCKHGSPCDDRCTCIEPMSSTGCRRCCTYGSDEQRAAMADAIRLQEAKAAAYDEAMASISEACKPHFNCGCALCYRLRDEIASGRWKP